MGLGRRNNGDSGRFRRSGHTSHATPTTHPTPAGPADDGYAERTTRVTPGPEPRREDPYYSRPRYPDAPRPGDPRGEDRRPPIYDERAARDWPRYDDRSRYDDRPPRRDQDRPHSDERPRHDQSGYDQAGYDQAGYDQAGYDTQHYDDRRDPTPRSGRPGHDPRYRESRYDESRYDEPRYDEPRYDGPRYREPRRDDRYPPASDRPRWGEAPHRVEPYGRDPYERDPYEREEYSQDPYERDTNERDAYERNAYERDRRPTEQIPRGSTPGQSPTPAHPTRELPPAARPSDGPVINAGQIPLTAGITAGAGAATGSAAKVTVTRAVASRSKQAAQTVTRKVVAASQADGAKESGLTPLIWNQVLSFGADAMITVALAGTVFFGASQGAQKGNVLGYLLITMAPFAVVAPIIGPALDRLQHGRRWAMAGTSFGRALLAVLMAQNFDNLLVLFPLALGSLVLSKAYSVVRAAAAPRVVPQDMTLVSANARLSIFGLGAAITGGGFIAGVIKVTHSYSFGLWLTAIAFAVTGYFSLRLPRQVDSANPSTRHPEEPPRPARMAKVPSTNRIRSWASRGFDPQVIIAMQGESLLRWASGFLTLFLAFYIQHTSTGFDAAAALGGIGLGVGLGNFVGTASGARIKLAHPEVIVLICLCACAVTCIVATFTFSLTTSIICMFVTSASNSLGKLSLDAVVQRDVNETLRSSAFAKSETFLQLAWVFGAAVALLLPVNKGTLGLGVAASFLGVTTVVVLLRTRAMGRSTQQGHRPAPGTV